MTEKRGILYEITRGLAHVLFHTVMPVRFHNKERLQQDPPFVLIANHRHALDPIAMAMGIPKKQIVFLGKKELAGSKLARNVLTRLHCILVGRHSTDMEAMRSCMKAVKMNKILLIFPEGTRHHEGQMEQIESGTALIAMRSKAPVIPIYFDRKLAFFHVVDKETIYTCYVLQNRLLVGTVSVKSLLLAPSDLQTIDSIMDTNLITVSTHTDQEEVAQMMSKYNLLAIPVVDGDNRMVGIVTFDDAMDVVEEEATEDMEIMAGMTPSDKTYLKSSPLDLFVHRIPWLSLLMISATFTGMIISGFEEALAKITCLAAFIPMLMDTGGNSGSQSSVTVIRALSLGELEFKDLGRVIWKEVRTALICGACLSVLCFAKVMLIDRLLMNNEDVSLMVGVVVGLTLAVTVLCAKLVGCTLPMLAKKLGFDPAVMASPFITTIVDALSLLVYFGIATTLLKI